MADNSRSSSSTGMRFLTIGQEDLRGTENCDPSDSRYLSKSIPEPSHTGHTPFHHPLVIDDLDCAIQRDSSVSSIASSSSDGSQLFETVNMSSLERGRSDSANTAATRYTMPGEQICIVFDFTTTQLPCEMKGLLGCRRTFEMGEEGIVAAVEHLIEHYLGTVPRTGMCYFCDVVFSANDEADKRENLRRRLRHIAVHFKQNEVLLTNMPDIYTLTHVRGLGLIRANAFEKERQRCEEKRPDFKIDPRSGHLTAGTFISREQVSTPQNRDHGQRVRESRCTHDRYL